MVVKQINVYTCLHSSSIQQQFYSAAATVAAGPTQLSYVRLQCLTKEVTIY